MGAATGRAIAVLAVSLLGCTTAQHHYQFQVPRQQLVVAPGAMSCPEACRMDPQVDACMARCPGVQLIADCDESDSVDCVASQRTFRRTRAIGPVGIITASVVFGLAAGIGASVNEHDGRDSYWYGVMPFDGAALGLGIASAVTDTSALGYGAFALYAAGPPLAHAVIHDRTHAYASLGLRLGIPAAFAGLTSIGAYLRECNALSRATDRAFEAVGNLARSVTGDEPIEPDSSTGACVARRAKAAFIVGMAGAALLDVAIVAWKDGDTSAVSMPLMTGTF